MLIRLTSIMSHAVGLYIGLLAAIIIQSWVGIGILGRYRYSVFFRYHLKSVYDNRYRHTDSALLLLVQSGKVSVVSQHEKNFLIHSDGYYQKFIFGWSAMSQYFDKKYSNGFEFSRCLSFNTIICWPILRLIQLAAAIISMVRIACTALDMCGFCRWMNIKQTNKQTV